MDFASLFSRQPPGQPQAGGIPDALKAWMQTQFAGPTQPNPGASGPASGQMPGAPALAPGAVNGMTVGAASPGVPGAMPSPTPPPGSTPPTPPHSMPPTPPGQPDGQKPGNLGLTNNSDQMLAMLDPNLKLPLMMGGGSGGGITGALKNGLSNKLMSLMGL